MSTVQLKPEKKQLTAWSAALTVLLALVVLFPRLGLPLGLLTPLFACPLAACRRWPLACGAVALPVLVGVYRQMPMPYAASAAVPCLLMLAVTCLPAQKRGGSRGLVLYLAASTVGLMTVVLCGSLTFGAPLAQTLASRAVQAVESSPKGAQILIQLVQAGLLPAGNAVLLPARQLLMSLELTVQNLLRALLPALFVQGAVLSGLFTAFAMRRAEGAVVVVQALQGNGRKATVLVQPGFSLLMIPRGLGVFLMGAALLSLPMTSSANSLVCTLGQLFSAAFTTAFALQGAAVLICAMTARRPGHSAAAGCLAAALYVLFPLALLMTGVSEQFFHYRLRILQSMRKDP